MEEKTIKNYRASEPWMKEVIQAFFYLLGAVFRKLTTEIGNIVLFRSISWSVDCYFWLHQVEIPSKAATDAHRHG